MSWEQSSFLEGAVVLELERPEFEILFLHKWHCAANNISLSELSVRIRLMDGRILESRYYLFLLLVWDPYIWRLSLFSLPLQGPGMIQSPFTKPAYPQIFCYIVM